MRVVYWQDIISPHQSAAIRALAERVEEVVLVACKELNAERRDIGWSIPDLGAARVLVAPDARTVEDLVCEMPGERVHLLGAARWHPLGRQAIAHCRRTSARWGLIAEAADSRGWRGLARRVKYTLDYWTVGRHLDFMLAVGQQGVRWFRQCGYPARIVFPYAYVVDQLPDETPARPADGGPFECMFLGRCAPGKGVETLLRALAGCRAQSWRLTVIGDGPLRTAWSSQSRALGLADRVQFLGALPNAAARRRLAAMDLLVLPSDGKEGWGAVVNEALMCGVPVLCSDRCGAVDVLGAPWRGEVVRAGSATALTQALARWIARGKTTPRASQRIRQWAQCLTGAAAADYLLAILAHVYDGAARPTAPWLRDADIKEDSPCAALPA